MYRIMVVDDEKEFLGLAQKLLSKDYAVEVFDSPLKALERADQQTFDAVISDYRMPEMDGVKFLKVFKERQPNAARIILSAYQDKDELIGAINEAQIYRFLSKPCNVMELVMTIAQAIAHRGLLLEREQLAEKVKTQAAEIEQLRAEVERLRTGG
ncbi:MAG: response regulator [Candidatus Nitrospinota bacterium M3_3B_026]